MRNRRTERIYRNHAKDALAVFLFVPFACLCLALALNYSDEIDAGFKVISDFIVNLVK